MKILIAGITAATVLLAALLLVGVYKSNAARQASAAKAAVTQVSHSTDRLPTLKTRIGRGATKDRWWMLLVGLTVVSYRLRQKHRALFENSLLYTSPGDFELHATSQVASFPSEFEEVPQRVARAN